ncbi:unnamed protein product [Calypogeia fissa]
MTASSVPNPLPPSLLPPSFLSWACIALHCVAVLHSIQCYAGGGGGLKEGPSIKTEVFLPSALSVAHLVMSEGGYEAVIISGNVTEPSIHPFVVRKEEQHHYIARNPASKRISEEGY